MRGLPVEVSRLLETLLPAILGSLQAVHDELDRALPEWRGRIEVAYVGLPSL